MNVMSVGGGVREHEVTDSDRVVIIDEADYVLLDRQIRFKVKGSKQKQPRMMIGLTATTVKDYEQAELTYLQTDLGFDMIDSQM